MTEPLKIPQPGAWSFKDAGVANDFDRHVREQLPWYDIATGIVAHIGRAYIPEGGSVIDIGASTGNVGKALAETIEQRGASFFAIDNSKAMVESYSGPGEAWLEDATEFEFADYEPDLIVAFLVLMFIPVAQRADLIRKLKAAVSPGGAVLVFDKMVSAGGNIGSVLYRLTLAAKYEAGATPEEIIQKELSLAGVQRPMNEAELESFVPVFRFGDFAGFLYERPAIDNGNK